MAVTPGISALEFLPPRISLASLRAAARGCRGCPLFKNATQTVFGEGKASARVVLIGEQPGNDEALSGRPFVGPAGRILDRALDAAGIARSDTYVTNVVKHFKWGTSRTAMSAASRSRAKSVHACPGSRRKWK